MLPLVMDLANPSPSLGWNSSERRSLRERGPVDLVMALALVHHLAIGNNVPFEQIAGFFHGICRSLVIEFVPKEDTQVQRLLRSREDIFPSYHQAAFEAAFSKLFTARRRTKVDDAVRTLYLYERKPG